MENKFELVESYQGKEMHKNKKIKISNDNLPYCGTIDGTFNKFEDYCKKTALVHYDHTFPTEKDDSGLKG